MFLTSLNVMLFLPESVLIELLVHMMLIRQV